MATNKANKVSFSLGQVALIARLYYVNNGGVYAGDIDSVCDLVYGMRGLNEYRTKAQFEAVSDAMANVPVHGPWPTAYPCPDLYPNSVVWPEDSEDSEDLYPWDDDLTEYYHHFPNER